MRIGDFAKSNLKRFYNAYAGDFMSALGCHRAPMGGKFGILDPGSRSTPHMHYEGELFIILYGSGTIRGGKEGAEAIGPGSIHWFPPFSVHWLENAEEGDLAFVSFWWSDAGDVTRAAEAFPEGSWKLPARALLTATPPTPNGDLHLGHLSGPFLAGDVLRRHLISKGSRVAYLTGIDDNQSYVPLKAFKDRSTPEQVATHYGDLIESTYRLGRIEYDLVLRPGSDPGYTPFVQRYFRDMHANGNLIEKEEEAFFSEETGKYHFEAHVGGKCPHCGSRSDGSACEQCGLPNQCVDLVGAESKYPGNRLVKRKVKRLYLSLESFRGELRSFWDRASMKPHLRSLCEEMASGRLPDIAMTHPTDWGLPCDIPGYADQRYYVWAEMAVGFLYAAGKIGPEWDPAEPDVWGADAAFYQFFGFDNGNFYVALFPAVWAAAGRRIRLPDGFITNEFLLLDGLKFSTSRSHAIWGNPFLSRVDPDLTRFYLAHCSPESFQADFRLQDFLGHAEAFWNGEFADYARDLTALMRERCADGIPATGAWTPDQVHFLDETLAYLARMERILHPARFSLHGCASGFSGYVRTARRFAQGEKLLFASRHMANECRTSIQLQLHSLACMAVTLWPLMPGFAASLWRSLGRDGEPRWTSLDAHGLDYRRFQPGFAEDLRRRLDTLAHAQAAAAPAHAPHPPAAVPVP